MAPVFNRSHRSRNLGPARTTATVDGGPDRAGNFFEVGVLHLDDGRLLAIHAMRMRPGYAALLP
jgi:hypothetical protein